MSLLNLYNSKITLSLITLGPIKVGYHHLFTGPFWDVFLFLGITYTNHFMFILQYLADFVFTLFNELLGAFVAHTMIESIYLSIRPSLILFSSIPGRVFSALGEHTLGLAVAGIWISCRMELG